MLIEILSIGNEILKGNIVNSNAMTMARMLQRSGYLSSRHTVVPDEPQTIKRALLEALDRADYVIVTGGLGPTADDHTKSIMAEVFETSFVFDPTLQEDLLKRYPNLITAKGLATIPKKAKVIPNKLGTAPGFLFSYKKTNCVFLPGVPFEMQAMMEGFVVPLIEKECPVSEELYKKEIDICLVNEDEVELVMKGDSKLDDGIDVGIYPFYGGVRVELTSSIAEKRSIDEITNRLEKQFADKIYSHNGESIEQVLLKTMEDNKETLAFAESCTGGALAATFTSLSGSSNVFLGSIVAYSDALKNKILHVGEDVLEEKGAVSSETISSMLEGIFKLTDADYAIATSGIAGPSGGTKDKPVGTVWVGVAKRNMPADIGLIHAPPSRGAVVQYTVNMVLGILWRKIVHNKLFFNGQK